MRNPNGEASQQNTFGVNAAYFITENISISAQAEMILKNEQRDVEVNSLDSNNNPVVEIEPLSEGKIETYTLKITGRL